MKNTPEIDWVDEGTEYEVLSTIFARRKTLSETKVEFAERAIQSGKHIIYRYFKDHGEKIILKLQKFVSNMNCRTKSPRDVISIELSSILYDRPFMKNTKAKFKIGDRVRI